MHRRLVSSAFVILAALQLGAGASAAEIPPTGEPIVLFDGTSMKSFETFVFGRGFNNDPDGIFRLAAGAVRVEGLPYGYFVTKQEFGDFYLRAEFKWGETTHGSRKNVARDSGILYRASSVEENAEKAKNQYSIWPRALEFQIMEGATGDVILLGGAELAVDGIARRGGGGIQIDRFNKTDIGFSGSGWPNGYGKPAGYRDPENEVEKPHGQWNVLEMVTDGDRVKYWVNGTLVMEGYDASETKGKILFQSEGSELYFARIEVRPLVK